MCYRRHAARQNAEPDSASLRDDNKEVWSAMIRKCLCGRRQLRRTDHPFTRMDVRFGASGCAPQPGTEGRCPPSPLGLLALMDDVVS